jgi:outer membrane receptor protein involved in Fe transport
MRGVRAAVSRLLRTLPICVPVALVNAPVALAQAVANSTLGNDIPAQPLAQALAAFASQTGLQLVYVSGVVRNQNSHAVPAGLSSQDALSRLLRGTGLRFEYLTPHSIRILAGAAPKTTTGSTTTDEEEVIVTANRREEAVQNVPMTIQVLTQATLARLNATTFDDFLSYLPGVTAHGVGPNQNNIYIRGLGTGDFANQAAGSNGGFPNVAVYLDEQSAQLPGRNLDIYTADLERVEVLEGPQGTLFGAGAEAGVLRYITNKPKLDVTETAVNSGYSTTAHGEASTAIDAMINIPLIAGQWALRAVIYNEKRGGYINNVPGTFVRASSDPSIHYAYAGGQVPANSVVINNSNQVANDINPVTYAGIRVQSLYRFSADWSVLVAQSYQDIDASGVFTEMAANSAGQPLPGLSVQMYNPSYNKDRFENTAVTIDGHVGDLALLYAGSYLVRNVDQVQDYTSYAHGGLYVDYYQCVNPGATPATARCFTPSTTWRDQERNTHQSQELRVTTPADWRIRGVGGLFYESYRIQDQGDWFYLTALPYFNPIGPPTGYYTVNGKVVCGCAPLGAVFVPGPVTSINPNTRPLGDGFLNDITRSYKQKAVYASVDFDLIPRTLTLTAGTRYFNNNNVEVGSIAGSFGCQLINSPGAPDPCRNRYSTDLNAEGDDRTYTGFRSRASLSWKVNDAALLYYTWSQGFRAGGFNRGFATPGTSPLAYVPVPQSYQSQAYQHKGWSAPLAYGPDELINNEVGWKTSWLTQRLQWTGAFYQEDWNHAQIGAFDLSVLGSSTINGGNYRVRGFETGGSASLVSGLTVEFGAAWNHSALVKQPTFYWADGTPINFGSLQNSSQVTLTNPAGLLGSPLAGAPPFQGNIRWRYEVRLNDYKVFTQLSAVHQAQSLSSTDRFASDLHSVSAAYNLPAFTSYDGALGVAKDAWVAQLFGENLSDTRAQLYANNHLYYKAVTVSRPRTVGLRVSYKFVDH